MQKFESSLADDELSGVQGKIASGGVKSLASGIGGIMDLVSRPKMTPWFESQFKAQNPGKTSADAEQAYDAEYKQTIGGSNASHIQDAATWLRSGGEPDGFWETVGQIGEQAMELLGPGEIMKLAGKAGPMVDAMGHLKQTQQAAQTLISNPKIAGLVTLGLKASKDAVAMGGQTYAHTEDPHQANVAAVIGGLTHLGAAGIGQVAQYLQKISPQLFKVGSTEMLALGSQMNEAGLPKAGAGTAGAPVVAASQQAGVKQEMGNMARDATRKVLDKINSTRPVFTATENGARLLPVPEAGAPPTFSLEGTPSTETPSGELVQSAAKTPGRAAFKTPQYTAESAPTREPIRPGGPVATEGTTGADITTAQTPEPRSDVVGGGGPVATNDPAEAQAWLRQAEDIQASPEYKNLSSEQQGQIEEQRQSLEDQLGLYHASRPPAGSPWPQVSGPGETPARYTQRFMPADTGDAALQHINTWGQAADHIQQQAQPIYDALDKASGGDFVKFNNEAKQAQKIMHSSTSMDAYEAAQERYERASQNISDLITRHSDQISREDYVTAKDAWRNSSRLNELHAVTERMMNGITFEESEKGLTRVMTGNSKQLQRYLDKGSNQDQIEQLIGKDGVFNLKQMTELLSKASTARPATEAFQSIAGEIAKHAGLGGVGGAIGGYAALKQGKSPWMGMLYGGMAGASARWVARDAMMNPRIGNMITHAVQNGIRKEIFAPLIARTILAPFEQQQQPEEEGQQ
jgi:hypothetical protein